MTTEKIVRSSDMPGGNLTSLQVEFMKAANTSPTFDRKLKPWQLVKIPKTSTKNVAWHVRIGEEDFLAIQISNSGQSVSIFQTDKKGKEANWSKPLKTYNTYVDLESAIDKFYTENHEKNTGNQPDQQG